MDIHMPENRFLAYSMLKIWLIVSGLEKQQSTKKDIQEKIHFCDKKMNDILNELNELVGSEEKNRIEMEKLKEQHRAAQENGFCSPTFIWNDC